MSNGKKKTAIVVEGGGMRCIFAAGVLHAFGNAAFDPYDLYIGVSAGACHLASHLAGQNTRNLDITLRYSIAREFINPWRFLRGGHLIDLDWMWEQTIRHYRLDLAHIDDKLRKEGKEYLIAVTSMETGRAHYLQPDKHTLEHDLKVSSAVPILYRSLLEINGEKMTDGGVADAIPVREAYRRGATDITVIRSRPSAYIKRHNPLATAVLARYYRAYPRLAERFKKRAADYRASVSFIRRPLPGVTVREIAPPATLSVGRTSTDERPLRALYQAGIDEGLRLMEAVKGLQDSRPSTPVHPLSDMR